MEGILIAILVVVSLALVGMARATELFAVRVRDGRFEFLRGRAPVALINDFVDVLRGARDIEIRAVVEGGAPSLRVRGNLDPNRIQRLRNVLGRFTTAQLRTAPRRRSGKG